jgi:hypothetical protein
MGEQDATKPRVSILKAIIILTTRLSSLRLSSSIDAPKIVLLYVCHDLGCGRRVGTCHDGGHKVDTRGHKGGHKNCARQKLKTLILITTFLRCSNSAAGERARPPVQSFFVLGQMNRTEPNCEPKQTNETEPTRTQQGLTCPSLCGRALSRHELSVPRLTYCASCMIFFSLHVLSESTTRKRGNVQWVIMARSLSRRCKVRIKLKNEPAQTFC